jgi:hypothetical protein
MKNHSKKETIEETTPEKRNLHQTEKSFKKVENKRL